MDLPIQITLRNLPHSPALEETVRERAAWLERFHPHLVSCRVVIELTGRHAKKGREFAVRIDLKVPGGEIAVDHRHDGDAAIAVRDAFDAARRRLEDSIRVQRGDVKVHRPSPEKT
jgi:ribosome-associated translation inhibitor RaiA